MDIRIKIAIICLVIIIFMAVPNYSPPADLIPGPTPDPTPYPTPYPTLDPTPNPTPDSTPISNPTFQDLINQEFEKLSSGRILFNPPEKMKVGVKKRIEVRLTKNITDNLTEGLIGSGETQIEEIKIGTFMKVNLTGNNFDINPLSSEEQVVGPMEFSEWSWDVVPLESGTQVLHFTVTVRILIPGQDEQKKDWDVMDKCISVEVNHYYTTKRFIDNYWRWIIATIISAIVIIPIILDLARRIRKK